MVLAKKGGERIALFLTSAFLFRFSPVREWRFSDEGIVPARMLLSIELSRPLQPRHRIVFFPFHSVLTISWAVWSPSV